MFSFAVYWFPPRQRTISRIVSSIRKVSKNKTAKAEYQHQPQSTSHGRIELGMHADTTVLGSNFVVLSYTGKECEVSPYSSEYEAVWNVPVVTGARVWINTTDGTAYLLIFYESLWMGDKLDHTLVNLNQLRACGVSVQDNAFNTKPLSITTDDVSVELYLEGMIICGDNRMLTESKLGQLPWLILTSLHDWDPHNVCFPSCSGQSSLITRHSQWTHYCNTQFTTQSWWHHSCHHMFRLLKWELHQLSRMCHRHKHSSRRNTSLLSLLQISVRYGILDWVERHKRSRSPHNG